MLATLGQRDWVFIIYNLLVDLQRSIERHHDTVRLQRLGVSLPRELAVDSVQY